MTIRIFLASSEELKPERLVIAETVTRLNYIWAPFDVSIRLIKWEYLDSSMGVKHKQEDYNDELRKCDMCMVLFWTRFGMYTETELNTAYELLNSNDSQMSHMVVLFKEGSEQITDELSSFRTSYEKQYPQLCQSFDKDTQLKDIFCQQVLECINKKNQLEHERLVKSLKKAQKLLAVTEEDEPDFQECKANYLEAKKAVELNESLMNKLNESLKGL